MISNFPHLLDKPFSIEITPASTGDTLTTDPSDTMVIRIIDKNLDEKQKHLFYYGSQNSIDAEFKGKYMDILLWEKNISANKITLSILFKLISHDMFVELFAFSASNKLERRMILKDLNLAKNLFRERIDLFYPAKLNFLIISLNNNNNNNYKLVEPNTRLTCIVKDGYPAPEITWQLITGPRNASMYYSIISNGSQLYIKSNSPIKSSWAFKCSVKGYSMITERIISFHIAVHPSQLYVEPEIKKWLQSNSKISCYIKDENLNPEIKWQLVKGPPNAFLYYDILNNGSEIYMNTNNLPGTIWTFRCNVKIVLTTTKLLNKTISFVIAKNFMAKCDEKCINTKLLDLEESIEKNKKLHQDINQIKLLINQSLLDFKKFIKRIVNWKINMENELDKFNRTLKNESNGNALTNEKNNKLQHDIIDQLKISMSTNFQRFNENNENWKLNVSTNLNKLSKTMETLKKRINENSKPILLSLNKPTNQSSTYLYQERHFFISAYAVDGNYSQDVIKDRRCAHTNHAFGNFWMVDLEKHYKIDHVVIYNREDCCQERLVGAIIEVLSNNNKIVDECGRISEYKKKYLIQCFSIFGQKIRIRFDKSEFLSLCEVEVFGLL